MLKIDENIAKYRFWNKKLQNTSKTNKILTKNEVLSQMRGFGKKIQTKKSVKV